MRGDMCIHPFISRAEGLAVVDALKLAMGYARRKVVRERLGRVVARIEADLARQALTLESRRA